MGCKIIVTGHGTFATGVESTMELIVGKLEHLYYFDFTRECTPAELKQQFKTLIEDHEISDCMFVCDILGGTPFKMAVELSCEMPGIQVVAGCNVGALVEGAMRAESMNACDLSDFVLEATTRSVAKFKPFELAQNDMEDGI